ncbi:reverse transcriptase N-terminal domain-containing protein [Pseudomonas sp. AB12(2023)]|nr:reverse transcriptase N-terminal domain-containing protein [Pseudomonas sp. AB12(2023)]
MNWYGLDWARIQTSVRKTQLKIAQATRKADWRKVKRLQRMLTHSFHGRCLAVRRVTEDRGRRTPGGRWRNVGDAPSQTSRGDVSIDQAGLLF